MLTVQTPVSVGEGEGWERGLEAGGWKWEDGMGNAEGGKWGIGCARKEVGGWRDGKLEDGMGSGGMGSGMDGNMRHKKWVKHVYPHPLSR